MEQDPFKSKLEVPELQEQIKSSEETIADIERQINLLMDDLEYNANTLKTKILFAEGEELNKGLEDIGIHYSPEKAENLKQDIIKSIATIHILRERITKLQNDREDVENIKLHLQTLEEQYNKQLASISLEQQN